MLIGIILKIFVCTLCMCVYVFIYVFLYVCMHAFTSLLYALYVRMYIKYQEVFPLASSATFAHLPGRPHSLSLFTGYIKCYLSYPYVCLLSWQSDSLSGPCWASFLMRANGLRVPRRRTTGANCRFALQLSSLKLKST